MDGHAPATRHTGATRITGHRGARGLWQENSLLGFRGVRGLGVDAVEFDVHLTRAGELLVLHDPQLERTTTGSGPVSALDPGERRALRLRGTDERIPTLAEVLDVLAEAPVDLHVEIKNDEAGLSYPGLVERVVDEIDRRGLRGRCHLASFDVTVLEECRRLVPEVARLVSVDAGWAERQGGMSGFLDRVSELVDIVAVHQRLLTEHWDLVTDRVPLSALCVWTINEAEDIRRWLDRGIGHLTSDRPDLALSIRQEVRGAGLGSRG